MIAGVQPVFGGASWFKSKVQGDKRFMRSGEIAQEILNEFDPQHFVILGLGRTTGVTSEWLRQLSRKDDYVFEAPVQELKQIMKLSKEMRHEVLKKLFPPITLLKGRHVVIHRVLWQGHTMKAILDEILQFMESEGYPLPLQLHLISGVRPESLLLTKALSKRHDQQRLQWKFIHDREFQDPFTDELYSNSDEKGLTEVGKYKAMTVSEVLSRDYKPMKNSYSDLLSQAIEIEICKLQFAREVRSF